MQRMRIPEMKVILASDVKHKPRPPTCQQEFINIQKNMNIHEIKQGGVFIRWLV